jgi:chlorite dismutase
METTTTEATALPEQIANYIFSYSPQKSNYYNLALEDESANLAINNNVIPETINSILSEITYFGIYKLYGHYNWMILSEEQQFKILQYTRSFGYNYKINIIQLSENEKKIKISFEKCYDI